MQIDVVEDAGAGGPWTDSALAAAAGAEEARVAAVIAGDPGPDADWGLCQEELQAPVDPYASDGAAPVDRIASDLRLVDRVMARVLRLMVQAGPRDGLSVRRQVGLLAGAPGADVGFLDRAVEVLRPMVRTQQAFDDGLLSWGQVRGIVVAARPLSVVQRELLDAALAGTIAQGRDRGEPDRVVEVAGDLAARIDAPGTEQDELAQERAQRVIMQPDFDGWATINGLLAPEVAATVGDGLDAAADSPVAADAPPPTDDAGRVLPRAARPDRSRSAQWAEALGRMAAWFLSNGPAACTCGTDGADHHCGRATGDQDAEDGHGEASDADPAHAPGCASLTTIGRGRPRALIVAPLADLLPDPPPRPVGVPGRHQDLSRAVTARLLWRRGNGRRRVSRALTRAIADDADLIAVFTDAAGMPVAISDAHAPITVAMRRAVTARDQGCRAPGCSAPPAHCDVHHVVPREEGGMTEVANLALMCRPCHTRLRLHRWRMVLDVDGVLRTRIGRTTYITLPRLTPPPTLPDPPACGDPPTCGDPPGDPPACGDPPGDPPACGDPPGDPPASGDPPGDPPMAGDPPGNDGALLHLPF